jgi:hypothetical protein
MVEWARRLDEQGQLHREFDAPKGLGEQKLDECLREEGWILGATTQRDPAARSQRPAVKGGGEHRAHENVRYIEALRRRTAGCLPCAVPAPTFSWLDDWRDVFRLRAKKRSRGERLMSARRLSPSGVDKQVARPLVLGAAEAGAAAVRHRLGPVPRRPPVTSPSV